MVPKQDDQQQQQQQQQPRIVLFAGPHKSGSTAVESFFHRYTKKEPISAFRSDVNANNTNTNTTNNNNSNWIWPLNNAKGLAGLTSDLSPSKIRNYQKVFEKCWWKNNTNTNTNDHGGDGDGDDNSSSTAVSGRNNIIVGGEGLDWFLPPPPSPSNSFSFSPPPYSSSSSSSSLDGNEAEVEVESKKKSQKTNQPKKKRNGMKAAELILNEWSPKNRRADIVVNYRSPRLGHLESIWHQRRDHVKSYYKVENKNNDDDDNNNNNNVTMMMINNLKGRNFTDWFCDLDPTSPSSTVWDDVAVLANPLGLVHAFQQRFITNTTVSLMNVTATATTITTSTAAAAAAATATTTTTTTISVVDMSGVKYDGLDTPHVIACEILGVPCHNGWVQGFETKQKQYIKNRRGGKADLTNEQRNDIETILQMRDCSYRHLIFDENDDDDDANNNDLSSSGVRILHRHDLFSNCTNNTVSQMYAKLQDSTVVVGIISKVIGCNGHSPTPLSELISTIFTPSTPKKEGTSIANIRSRNMSTMTISTINDTTTNTSNTSSSSISMSSDSDQRHGDLPIVVNPRVVGIFFVIILILILCFAAVQKRQRGRRRRRQQRIPL